MRNTDEIIKEMEDKKIRDILEIIHEIEELHKKEERLLWELRKAANYEGAMLESSGLFEQMMNQ